MTEHFLSPNFLLKVNVGFLLKESAGYVRDIPFDQAGLVRADDVEFEDLQGELRFARTPQGILVSGTLQATTRSECVRCLKPIGMPFRAEFSELFRPFGDAEDATGEGQHVISEGDDIDLTPILREEAILAVPMHAVCSESCKGLCPHCGQNLNEKSCGCQHEEIDPRLAVLRTLLDE